LPEQPLVLRGDAGLLEEVVTNVIANAVEAFEGRAGVVEVRLSRQPSGSAAIIVEDSGPGIPESLRHTLFQPYVTTKARGTGLGLAFCKKVIEEHQGTIEAGSSPLGGARFEVNLPANSTKERGRAKT
jgi:signal transduction histidine kinase